MNLPYFYTKAKSVQDIFLATSVQLPSCKTIIFLWKYDAKSTHDLAQSKKTFILNSEWRRCFISKVPQKIVVLWTF